MRVTAISILAALTAYAGVSWAGSGDQALVNGSSSAAGPSANIVGASDATAAPPSAVLVQVPLADEVVVHKSERKLYLMRHGEILRTYRIALGLVPEGRKARSGDFRTPEGHYLLTRRNPRSDYFLSILVSYPNDQDEERAHRDHVDPGGAIMIHGLPNSLRHPPGYYSRSDWTDGCIALSDSDMVEVWLMTRENTPIEILP
jgi:hypothetical protein